jgi:CubicO group peptidase (beta-lactamase class C family)
MTSQLRATTAALLAVLVVDAGPQSQDRLPDAAAAAVDRLAEEQLARARVPGLSIAIAFQNRIVYSKGFGMADLEHGVAVTPNTRFRTASVAKPLTAAGVMALWEAGRLDLDAPVRQYCPAWPASHKTITARQLLAHLAGVRHYQKPREAIGTTAYFSIDDSLALFRNDALMHEPGSRYLYSTYGYSILGCAIEGASGLGYAEYMRQRVFDRAGMARTRTDFHYDVVPDRASGYMLMTEETHRSLPPSARAVAKPGQIYNASLHDTSMKVPGGGLVSTAEDLARFGIALNTAALLRKDTVETMWTEQKTTGGRGTGYGLGWGVTPMQDGIRRLTHSGNQAGAATLLNVIPEVGVTVAIMTNLEDFDPNPLYRGIAAILRRHLAGGGQQAAVLWRARPYGTAFGGL